MDLYFKIMITLLIIGITIFLILSPFISEGSKLEKILLILVAILIGGGLSILLLGGTFEVLKLIWGGK